MKIWALGIDVCSMPMCTFDVAHVKGIMGSFGALFPRLIVEQNGKNLLSLGGVCGMHIIIFYLEHVKVTYGHSAHFSEKKGS